jgi:hypothetical protein
VQTLPEQTLAAIGRMTVAATDLEYLLAWIGTGRAAGESDVVFARPGESLPAARGWARLAPADVRPELIAAVEAAATQLALSQAALRRLWRDDSPAATGPSNRGVSGRWDPARSGRPGYGRLGP